MAVGLAENRGAGHEPDHQQSLPDEVGGRVPGQRSALLGSRWDILVAIAGGGALGSLARYGVGTLLPWDGSGFPWATFVENVSGAFALGLLMVFLLEVWPPRRYLRPFLGVGVLGGYTTFSTYMLETRDLLVAGEPTTAAAYLFGSLVTGLVAVATGVGIARLVVRRSARTSHEGANR
jgi:CrcB protein